MANATSFSGGVYWAAGGSSYQFVVAMTSPPSFYSIRPYGESEDAASPHYADQTALYTNNQFKLMPFTLSDVIAHSTGSQIYCYDPRRPPSAASRKRRPRPRRRRATRRAAAARRTRSAAWC